jgi:hypothetical protein
MIESAEKRCDEKSWWFMSQFCGSGLRSRSNVTSAAPASALVPSNTAHEKIIRLQIIRVSTDFLVMVEGPSMLRNDATSCLT